MRIRNIVLVLCRYFEIHINFTLMETAVCITPVWNTGTYTHHCVQSHSMCCWFITHEYPPRAHTHTHTHTHDSTKWDSFLGQETCFLDMNGKSLLQYWCHIFSKYFPYIYVTDVLPLELINKAERQNNTKSHIPWNFNIQNINRYC